MKQSQAKTRASETRRRLRFIRNASPWVMLTLAGCAGFPVAPTPDAYATPSYYGGVPPLPAYKPPDAVAPVDPPPPIAAVPKPRYAPQPVSLMHDAEMVGMGAIGSVAGQRLLSARNGAAAVKGATGSSGIAVAGTATGRAATVTESAPAQRVAARIAAAAEGDAEKQTVLQMAKRAWFARDWVGAARLLAPLAAEVAEGEETIALLEVLACLMI
jgi:hypothetical protein